MGLWLQMTGCFKGTVNYFESKSKAGQVQGVSMPLTFSLLGYTLHISFSWHLCGLLQLRKYEAFLYRLQTRACTLHKLFEGLKTRFKMVNWSSEGFIEELSLVHAFPTLWPIGIHLVLGLVTARLTAQDLVVHRLLIPCMVTYLTEGLDLHTLKLHTWKSIALLLACPFPVFSSTLFTTWWFTT